MVRLAIAPILLILIVLLVVAVRVTRGRRLFMAAGRRPRKRHVVTRIICASVGAAILIAVGVGTWLEVSRCYAAAEAAATAKVSVPTGPAPPLPRLESFKSVERARVLMHVLFVEVSPHGTKPLGVMEFDVHWPADRGRRFAAYLKFKGIKATYRFSINDIRFAGTGEREYGWEIRLQGSQNWVWWSASRRSSGSGGSIALGPAAYLSQVGWSDKRLRRPLSVLPPVSTDVHALGFVTRAAEDDPLKQVPLAEFFRARAEQAQQLVDEHDRYAPVAAQWRGPGEGPPGIAFAWHVGIASLLLLVAAVLLTQLFRRRELAFAGVVLALVFYVAVLDQAVLGAHLSRLNDPEAPLTTRLTACDRARDTFFYRQTARGNLEDVARQDGAPKPLRAAATRMAQYLQYLQTE